VKRSCRLRARNDAIDPQETLTTLADGEQVVILSHYLLTDPCQFDILHPSGPWLADNRMHFGRFKRREFFTLLGGAVAWPLAARAQQPAMPVIGFLSGRSQNEASGDTAAFHQGLNELGYVDGRNVAVEYRWADGRNERLPDLAAALVRRQVAVLAAVGGNDSALAAKAATATIPIVFTSGADPVKVGLVASFNRPGGNVTGVSWFSTELGPKRMGLLNELVPNITIAALVVNPRNREFTDQAETAQQVARVLGWRLHVIGASSENEIDAAFALTKQQRANAIVMGSDPFFRSRLKQIIALAAHDAIPTIYVTREFVEGGGLISYGNSVRDAYRRAGIQTGRLLKGAKPTDLPVDQATKFELVINLKTAKALGLTVPDKLLVTADEVIE
jgi:putative tryptophan/tyrosine transport system substrate-binding protein